MGPPRKNRSVNKKYSYMKEASPSKDVDVAKKGNSRKRKLHDLLGPRWTTEELTRFYDAYRKHEKDWRKVAGAVRNRTSEMAETLYTMNRAYLSLPHGTASAAGLIAMMTDHYSNLAGSDSDQESNDGARSSRKTQKRARVKVQSTSSRAPDEQVVSHSDAIDYGCASLLKKKPSGVGGPRSVKKRTPRYSVGFSYESRQGLKIKPTANDDEVAHEVAIALAEASQRGGSQVSRTPSKRAESSMSSPSKNAQGKQYAAERVQTKLLAADIEEEDLEGSTEADTGELSRYRSYMMDSGSIGVERQKGKHVERKKVDDGNNENHLDNIKEESSGTGEGQRLSSIRRGKFELGDTDAKTSGASMQSQRKNKKFLFGKDEEISFDALQTLVDLSLMTENENEREMQIKGVNADGSLPLEASPVNQQREKRRSAGLRMKSYQPVSRNEAAPSRAPKSGKASLLDAELIQDNQPIGTKTSRRRQKMQGPKIQESEARPDIHLSAAGIEAGDAGQKTMAKTKKSTKTISPKLLRVSENSSWSDLPKQGSDSAQSAEQASEVNKVTLPTKARSRRKIDLKKPEAIRDLKYPDKMSNDQSNLPFTSFPDRVHLQENLSNCLSNQLLRKWCTYEWFYSAIDYPWFAKREFVEYLFHVGLGHVPRLTRVEWGVIRSSLGKPRRFSVQFLKEEKEKLNKYRESVRRHYTELREGVREGLPTDLARPLSVGQRVIAIHPSTREIHDGSVLTVDHSRCRIQFDRQNLGSEFVEDIDCMPLNPCDNMPAVFGRRTAPSDKFLENFNDPKVNGLTREYTKLSSGDNLDKADYISRLSPLVNPASLKQTKVSSSNASSHSRMGPADSAFIQQTPHSQPSSVAQIQSREADIQALAELRCALEKKGALVQELKRMNDDVSENPIDGGSPLKESEMFKKQYAAVLVKLNETNDQVYAALHSVRERNTYQGNSTIPWPRPDFSLADRVPCEPVEPGSHVNEIADSSMSKAQTMVNVAMQALTSLKVREDTFDKIEEAIDYVNDRLPSDDMHMPMVTDHKMTNTIGTDTEAQIPAEMITKCVATLLMIQKCTERQFPPSDVAQILDSAVTSLQPRSAQNLPVYTEIQKCMGIIRNQILALIPT